MCSGVMMVSALLSANFISPGDKVYEIPGCLRLIFSSKVDATMPKDLPLFNSHLLHLIVSSFPIIKSYIFAMASLIACMASGIVCC